MGYSWKPKIFLVAKKTSVGLVDSYNSKKTFMLIRKVLFEIWRFKVGMWQNKVLILAFGALRDANCQISKGFLCIRKAYPGASLFFNDFFHF